MRGRKCPVTILLLKLRYENNLRVQNKKKIHITFLQNICKVFKIKLFYKFLLIIRSFLVKMFVQQQFVDE